jgi:hypothetical protein
MNSLRDCGFYDAELYLRQHFSQSSTTQYTKVFIERRMNSALYLSGTFKPSMASIKVMWSYLKVIAHYYAHRQKQQNNDEDHWFLAEAGLFWQNIAMKLFRSRLIRWFGWPLRVLLLWQLSKTLQVLIDEVGKPKTHAPHIVALIQRLDNFMQSYLGGITYRLFTALHKEPTRLLDVSDGMGDLYRETDSILGVINHSRNNANQDMNDWLSLGLMGRRNNKYLLDESEYSFRLASFMARQISDQPGMIKNES